MVLQMEDSQGGVVLVFQVVLILDVEYYWLWL